MNEDTMTPNQLLEEAEKAVLGPRQEDYGPPGQNHRCTADLWSAFLSRTTGRPIAISPDDVCNMNILQKISREANSHKDDNDVDIIGYALNKAMMRHVT